MNLGSEAHPRPWSMDSHPLVARFQRVFAPAGAKMP